MNKTKKLTFVTMLSALAIVANMIENAFLPELPLDVRFGIANIMAIIAIKLFSSKEMLVVNIMRVTLGNLLAGTIFGTRFFIAIGGIILSSISLIITDKLDCSIPFTSIVSAFFHTAGQILVVCYIYSTTYMLTALPLYVFASLASGLLTGLIASAALKRIKL